ncbi:MAG: hypothetical protein U9Q81_15735 [Pseudomonadota bacterium]|nr:hypothetical protein [Pseudomonadota bacterium]
MPVKAINLLVSLLFSVAALADRGPDLPDYPADAKSVGSAEPSYATKTNDQRSARNVHWAT